MLMTCHDGLFGVLTVKGGQWKWQPVHDVIYLQEAAFHALPRISSY